MKNFDFLLCFVLCVLPCVFTEVITTEEKKIKVAKTAGITTEELQECLDKVDTDLGTILGLTDEVFGNSTLQSQEKNTKAGCFSACVLKKNGGLVNSKIVPEKIQGLMSGRVAGRPDLIELVRTTSIDCNNRVSDKTDDCDITFSFARCFVQEMARQARS